MRQFEVTLTEDSGIPNEVCFNSLRWIERTLKRGMRLALHGRPQEFRGRYSFTHPDFDLLHNDGAALDTGRIVALYPGGAALEQIGRASCRKECRWRWSPYHEKKKTDQTDTE